MSPFDRYEFQKAADSIAFGELTLAEKEAVLKWQERARAIMASSIDAHERSLEMIAKVFGPYKMPEVADG